MSYERIVLQAESSGELVVETWRDDQPAEDPDNNVVSIPGSIRRQLTVVLDDGFTLVVGVSSFKLVAPK